jgi:hypothetical protein
MLTCVMTHVNITMHINYFKLLFTPRYTNQNCVRVVPADDGQVMPKTCRGFEF